MATHDYVISNASGAAVRADLNNALAAIVSNNSNASAPATTYSYQWWADTTAGQLKLRNSANDGWIVIQELDGTMLMDDGSAASPGLAFASDLDTGLLRPGTNSIAISTAGNQRLVVDASGQVGIGETTPGTLVEIGSTAPYVTLKNSTQEDSDGGRESKVIFEGEQSGGEITTLAQIDVSHDGTADDQKGKLILSTNDGADGAAPTAALTIGSDQKVVASGDIQSTSQNGSALAGFRNQIINGNFTNWQRGISFNNIGVSYTADRWLTNLSASSQRAYRATTSVPSLPFAISLEGGSPDYLTQRVELINANSTGQFGIGTTWTLSWYSTAPNGTSSGRIRFFGSPSTARNDWTRVGSIETIGTEGPFTRYSQKYTVPANVGNCDCVDVTIQRDNSTTTWQVTGVQLEPGPVATPIELRPIATELALCQRYFYSRGRQQYFYGQSYDSGVGIVGIFHPVTMRAAPTLTDVENFGNLANFGDSRTWGFKRTKGATGSVQQVNADFSYTASAEL